MSENEQEIANESGTDSVESSPAPAEKSIVERGMAALGIGDAEPEQEAAATPATKTYKQNAAANAATKRKRKYGR